MAALSLLMVGINHRTAPLELRERLALNEQARDEFYRVLAQHLGQTECILLSTCNRTEIYLSHPDQSQAPAGTDSLPDHHDDVQLLVKLLGQISNLDMDCLLPAIIVNEGEQAVTHLFRVACGLDSMVLGEAQILGQVKRAYEVAQQRKTAGAVLHVLFQRAIGTAKSARTDTGMARGRISVGSVAVDFARQIFERFDDKTVLAIGAGEVAKLTLRHLSTLQPARLLITNRSLSRANALLEQLALTPEQGEVRSFDQLEEMLLAADVVIASTSADQPLITPQQIKPLLRRRRHRPLVIIDLALPRNVDPAVHSLPDVYLYNLDDLQSVISETFQYREQQIKQCTEILNRSVVLCMHEFENRDIGQVIRALRQKLHALGYDEQKRTTRKIASANPQDIDRIIQEHSRRLINKILHLPLATLDRQNRLGSDQSTAEDYMRTLRQLFDLDDHKTKDHELYSIKRKQGGKHIDVSVIPSKSHTPASSVDSG